MCYYFINILKVIHQISAFVILLCWNFTLLLSKFYNRILSTFYSSLILMEVQGLVLSPRVLPGTLVTSLILTLQVMVFERCAII